jgi:hypothetical protein
MATAMAIVRQHDGEVTATVMATAMARPGGDANAAGDGEASRRRRWRCQEVTARPGGDGEARS